jgi:ELWxxDGT repeat protein
MKPFLFSLFFLLFSKCILAQNYTVELVKNLNNNTGSNPRWFTEWNGALYFFANDGIDIHKIYSLTPNTLPVMCNNVTGNAVFGDGTISTNDKMGIVNNKLYIPILGNPIGRELYSYDAVSMPSIVMDINPGSGSGNPRFFVTHNNKLYFQATSPITGTELWVHDPIANTTTNLTDINVGPNSSTVANITLLNNKLYFSASNGNDTFPGHTGIELYCYDIATNTTIQIADIYPGNIGSNPTMLSVVNNDLFFVATDPIYGKELYKYDGSQITRLTDINPGTGQGVYTSDQSCPTYFNGSIYFAANESNNLINLGKYDLTTNTVSIIYCAGATHSCIPRYFTLYDNKLFFSSTDTISGIEIWHTNGIAAPSMVWDVNPGTPGSNARFFTLFNNALYFNAFNDTTSGEELFKLSIKPIDHPSGVSDLNKQQYQVSISPNPCHESLTILTNIEKEASLLYQLIDSKGSVVLSTAFKQYSKGKHQENIELNNISNGMYFFQMKDGNGHLLYSEKVIKQ